MKVVRARFFLSVPTQFVQSATMTVGIPDAENNNHQC